MPRKGSSTSRIQRSLEEQGCRNPIREKATEIMMLTTESRQNSSGTFSQDSQRCSSVIKSMNLLSEQFGTNTSNYHRNNFFLSMFNDISCDRKDNEDECLRNAESVKVFARRFGIGQWSFIGPGSEKNWYSCENSPQGAWDNIAEQMFLEFSESGHPIFRATSEENCLYTSPQIKTQVIQFIALFFLSISSVFTGAVAAVCEEFDDHQDRTF